MNLTPGPARGFDSAWSPDGSRIAFASERDSDCWDIWVMEADGSDPVRLTDLDDPQTAVCESAYEPAWSPDGSCIAFTRDGNEFFIYMMDADGSNLISLVMNPHKAARPTWSPDGTRLGFSASGAMSYEVFVVDADGSNAMSLTGPDGGLYPAWSPSP